MFIRKYRLSILMAIGIALTFNFPVMLQGQNSLVQMYPQLSGTTLAEAQVTMLPEDVLLQADDISITYQDVESQMASIPEQNRHQLTGNELFVVEQMFTEQALVAQARQELTRQGHDISGILEQELFQMFFAGMMEDVQVTEQEITEFYESNPQMMGGMPLEEAGPQIEHFLQQQKQQDILEEYIEKTMGDLEPQISEVWVEEKVSMSLDNELDQARVSGKPTSVTFDSSEGETYEQVGTAIGNVGEEMEGEANVIILAIEEYPILANRYAVQSVPTTIFFDEDGDEVSRTDHLVGEEQIKQHLQMMID